MNINMIRTSTSGLQSWSLPDANQVGYGTYKTHLPHFMSAHLEEKKVNLTSTGVQLPFMEDDLLKDWGLPDLVLGWRGNQPENVMEELRQRYDAEDVMVNGRAGLILRRANQESIAYARDNSVDPVFPCAYGTSNIATIPAAKLIVRIAQAFLHLHQYPAFSDKEHFDAIVSSNSAKEDGSMIVDDGTTVVLNLEEYGIKWVSKNPEKQQYTNLKGLETLAKYNFNIPETNILPWGGLWFPYISDLALHDMETVPDVISRFFMGCLGDTVEDIAEIFSRIKSAWGNLGKTEWGKRMSHLYRCIELAIGAQAVVKIRFDDVYSGAAILGSNFTISVVKQEYRPGSVDQLRDAIGGTGSNIMLLRQVAAICKVNVDDIAEFSELKTLWAIRMFMKGYVLTEDHRKAIIEKLRFFRSSHQSWAPSVFNFNKAAELMSDGHNLSDYPAEAEIPLHASMMFNYEKKEVIWSCFGGVAPSFRVPGGSVYDLTSAQNVVKRGAIGGSRGKSNVETLVVTKISLRMVALELALEDLRIMMREKKILNPFAQPNFKRSAQNQWKTFAGAGAASLVSSLRRITEAHIDPTPLSSGTKRPREDDGKDKPGKRRVLDW